MRPPRDLLGCVRRNRRWLLLPLWVLLALIALLLLLSRNAGLLPGIYIGL